MIHPDEDKIVRTRKEHASADAPPEGVVIQSVQKPLWGFDVSNLQGNFPVGRAKAEGFDFALFKVSQGTYFKDAYYAKNAREAKDAGLVYGGYHFMEHGNIPAQVDLFLSLLGDPEGKLVAVDVESGGYYGDPNVHDVWNFIHLLHDRIGDHPILLYSGNWYWAGHLGNPDLTSLVKDAGVYLWDSHYVYGGGYASSLYRNVPLSWWRYCWGGYGPTILQFSANGVVCGRSPIDVDAFAGTRDDLLKLTGRQTVKPRPVKVRRYNLIYDGSARWARERADWVYGRLGRKLVRRCPSAPEALYVSRRALASKNVGEVVAVAIGRRSLSMLDPAARANISSNYRGYGHGGRDITDIWDATTNEEFLATLATLEAREKAERLVKDFRKEFKL